jgi:hypothetical protein
MDDPARGARSTKTLALVALAVALGALFLLDPAARPSGFLRDFNAFYCAGSAVDAGADPYLAEPLGSCERLPQPPPLATGRAGLAVPAPLPPYTLLPFALLARLPYPVAAALWCIALLAAVAIAVAAMRRATGLPLIALIAAFALGDGYASISLGQLAPLAVAGLALATMFAQERRDAAAGWAAAFAMLEPHVGLPACVALFVWKSGSRLPLALSAFVLTGASLWLVGPATALEYGRNVVPAHALSELANEKQFSLSYLAHRLGAGDELALRLGTLSYLAALALGCTIAAPLAQRLRSPGMIAALPPALALVGGPFLHIAQMPAALPCALLLHARVPALRRALAAILILLAIPWVQFTTLGTAFGLLAAVAAAVLGRTLGGMRAVGIGVLTLVVIGFVASLLGLVQAPVPDPDSLLAANYDPHALAETSWGLYVRTVAHANLLAFDLARVPTLASLLALAWFAIRLAARPSIAVPAATFAPGGNGSNLTERKAR